MDQEKKQAKINVFGHESPEIESKDSSSAPESILLKVKYVNEEMEKGSAEKPEKFSALTSFMSNLKERFKRKQKIKETSTLAHLVCHYYYIGLSYEDIADKVNLSVSEVKEGVEEALDSNILEKLALEYVSM